MQSSRNSAYGLRKAKAQPNQALGADRRAASASRPSGGGRRPLNRRTLGCAEPRTTSPHGPSEGVNMIGMYAEHSGTFLRVFAVLTALPFSIPILLAPLAWARTFRWTVDAQPDLALYFGRCLGAFALVLSFVAWHVAGQPELQPLYFKMLIGIAA